MVTVSDLIPTASGKAAIGVILNTKDGGIGLEGLGGGLQTDALYPFFNIHCLSGIYHDPQYGQSGIIRYTRKFGLTDASRFEKSVNGGLSFTTLFTAGNVTLQNAYQRGRFKTETIQHAMYYANGIDIASNPGTLSILGKSRGVHFVSNSGMSPLNMSGTVPFDTTNPGDLTMLYHSITSGTPLDSTQKQRFGSDIKARSMGLGTLVLNTGSGLVNIAIGSGIAQYRIVGSINIDFNSTSGTTLYTDQDIFSDLNYASGQVPNASVSGKSFSVWSPGLYECSYHASFQRTGGTTQRILKCQMFRNTHELLTASVSYAFSQDSTYDECTAHATFLFEANSGDSFNLQCGFFGSSGSSDTLVTQDNKGWILVRKIGSRRHEVAIVGI